MSFRENQDNIYRLKISVEINKFFIYLHYRFFYFVVEKDSKIVDGVGISPLEGMESIIETQKKYLLKKIRGVGLGQVLMIQILLKAKELGYKKAYLETLKSMKGANKLYQKFGFYLLDAPLGDTGHFVCDAWYLKELEH